MTSMTAAASAKIHTAMGDRDAAQGASGAADAMLAGEGGSELLPLPTLHPAAAAAAAAGGVAAAAASAGADEPTASAAGQSAGDSIDGATTAETAVDEAASPTPLPSADADADADANVDPAPAVQQQLLLPPEVVETPPETPTSTSSSQSAAEPGLRRRGLSGDFRGRSVGPRKRASYVWNRPEQYAGPDLVVEVREFKSRLEHVASRASESFAYLFLRALAYFFSIVLYVVISTYDDRQGDRRVWRLERTNTQFILQVVITLITLLDTILRFIHFSFVKPLHAVLSNPYDVLNVGLAVLVLMGFAVDDLVVPSFLHVWTLRATIVLILEVRAQQLQRRQQLDGDDEDYWSSRLLVDVTVTILTIIFTAACGLEHLEKGSTGAEGVEPMNLFDALWCSVITLSTVGYGDLYPVSALGRIFVMGIVVVALVILPDKFSRIAELNHNKARRGGHYNARQNNTNGGHVLLCGGLLDAVAVEDFLEELHAEKNTKLPPFVVILSPHERSTEINRLLRRPLYRNTTKYILGSALVRKDLVRAGASTAEAVFLLTDRHALSERNADHQTILRAWAINDLAPKVPLYVQILNVESMKHVKFCTAAICLDELRYALIANNCNSPGVSTLITVLLHTSDPHSDFADKEISAENSNDAPTTGSSKIHSDMMGLYKRCIGNQIFSVTASQSRVFADYIGASFGEAAYDAISKRICLFGVKTAVEGPRGIKKTVVLNPGDHTILKDDVLYYIAQVDESRMDFRDMELFDSPPPMQMLGKPAKKQEPGKSTAGSLQESAASGMAAASTAPAQHRPVADRTNSLPNRPTTHNWEARHESLRKLRSKHTSFDNEEAEPMHVPVIVQNNVPEHAMYHGSPPVECHLVQFKTNPARTGRPSESIANMRRQDLRLAPEHVYGLRDFVVVSIPVLSRVSSGVYLFLRILRSSSLNPESLYPVVFIFPEAPSRHLLRFMSLLPEVFFCVGDLEQPDMLLRECVTRSHMVLVLSELISDQGQEGRMIDTTTIMAAQNTIAVFPDVHVVAELNYRGNIRFLSFKAADVNQEQPLASVARSFVFRPAYVGGHVFSASMTDTALYQCFQHYKEDLIEVVRKLLQLDEVKGMSRLTRRQLTREIIEPRGIRNYGNLARYLIKERNEIALGLYVEMKEEKKKRGAGKKKHARSPKMTRHSKVAMDETETETEDRRFSEWSSSSNWGSRAFVLSSPDPLTPVREGDYVYVLTQPFVGFGNSTKQLRFQSSTRRHESAVQAAARILHESQKHADSVQAAFKHWKEYRRPATSVTITEEGGEQRTAVEGSEQRTAVESADVPTRAAVDTGDTGGNHAETARQGTPPQDPQASAGGGVAVIQAFDRPAPESSALSTASISEAGAPHAGDSEDDEWYKSMVAESEDKFEEFVPRDFEDAHEDYLDSLQGEVGDTGVHAARRGRQLRRQASTASEPEEALGGLGFRPMSFHGFRERRRMSIADV